MPERLKARWFFQSPCAALRCGADPEAPTLGSHLFLWGGVLACAAAAAATAAGGGKLGLRIIKHNKYDIDIDNCRMDFQGNRCTAQRIFEITGNTYVPTAVHWIFRFEMLVVVVVLVVGHDCHH